MTQPRAISRGTFSFSCSRQTRIPDRDGPAAFVREFTEEGLFSRDMNTPIPSGNASFSWLGEMNFYRPSEVQLNYAAVGVASRFPHYAPRAYDDIQVELVCVRPEPVEGSEDRIDPEKITTPGGGDNGGDNGGTQNDDSGSSAPGVYPVTATLCGLAAVVAALSLL